VAHHGDDPFFDFFEKGFRLVHTRTVGLRHVYRLNIAATTPGIKNPISNTKTVIMDRNINFVTKTQPNFVATQNIMANNGQ
jgi:hypothetical protein